MNEAQTRKHLIDPALKAAGWDTAPARWVDEFPVAPGRIGSDAKHHDPKFADYVLFHGKRRVAVVEAKRSLKSFDAGETQARFYAEALGIRFAYATNGVKVLEIDMETQETREFPMGAFPTAAELLAKVDGTPKTALETACAEVPWSRAGGKEIRYYQERAVEAVLHRFGEGARRALLTLATGTGKTFIAYQLAHKLTAVKWKKDGLGEKEPRILFITDRNFLANQAFSDFCFPTGKCFRYEAGTELKPDRQIYFTLFQTLLGEDGNETKYKLFGKDFFDLVIIDECHRGGANDETQWRKILEYFDSAAHLGLTATPKADVNGSTYEYFGKPAYVYSLRQGIEDGFLSPYRVERCRSTLETYQVEDGDIINFPEEIDDDKIYQNDEIERKHIRIKERDRHFVDELFKRMPPDQKAIVFCVTQKHARRIARLVNKKAVELGIFKPHYCETVTADAGTYGDYYLRLFQDNDLKIPTILTTSEKLSTGMNARNVRSIVFYRNVNSMVEFRQIVGRGSRTYTGKPYFTIYDFVGVTEKFKDDDWGRPDVPCPKCGQSPCICGKPERKPCPVCGQRPCVCEKVCPRCGLPLSQCTCPPPERHEIEVKLSSGRDISAIWESFVFFDDEMISTQDFLERFVSAVKRAAAGPDELRDKWSGEESRKDFLEAIADAGFDEDLLKDVQKIAALQDCDVFDVILDLVYDVRPVTRAMRVERLAQALESMSEPRRKFAEIVLANYVADGVWKLTRTAFTDVMNQLYGGNIQSALSSLGFATPKEALDFFGDIQQQLYAA
ncbi:MAG: DEAD/DEAH box helicase family protein [Kiritimatiellae bacterium]|nr:DEAD/DEAH box helicase family protein [Kiritimatiellia bacterium]